MFNRLPRNEFFFFFYSCAVISKAAGCSSCVLDDFIL